MRSTGAGHSAAPVKAAGIQRRDAAVAEETASSPRAEEQTKKRRQGAVETPDAATASSTSSNCSTYIRAKKKLRFRKMSEAGKEVKWEVMYYNISEDEVQCKLLMRSLLNSHIQEQK